MGRLYIHQELDHWTGCPASTFYRRKLHSRPHIGISRVEGTSSLVRTFLIEALSRDRYLQDTLHKPRLGFQCQDVSERSFLKEILFPFLNFSLPRNCYISPVPLHLTAPFTVSIHPSPLTPPFEFPQTPAPDAIPGWTYPTVLPIADTVKHRYPLLSSPPERGKQKPSAQSNLPAAVSICLRFDIVESDGRFISPSPGPCIPTHASC